MNDEERFGSRRTETSVDLSRRHQLQRQRLAAASYTVVVCVASPTSAPELLTAIDVCRIDCSDRQPASSLSYRAMFPIMRPAKDEWVLSTRVSLDENVEGRGGEAPDRSIDQGWSGGTGEVTLSH